MIHFENKPHQSWKYKHHIQATFSDSLKSNLGICCHSHLLVMEYLIFYPVFRYFLYDLAVKFHNLLDILYSSTCFYSWWSKWSYIRKRWRRSQMTWDRNCDLKNKTKQNSGQLHQDLDCQAEELSTDLVGALVPLHFLFHYCFIVWMSCLHFWALDLSYLGLWFQGHSELTRKVQPKRWQMEYEQENKKGLFFIVHFMQLRETLQF